MVARELAVPWYRALRFGLWMLVAGATLWIGAERWRQKVLAIEDARWYRSVKPFVERGWGNPKTFDEWLRFETGGRSQRDRILEKLPGAVLSGSNRADGLIECVWANPFDGRPVQLLFRDQRLVRFTFEPWEQVRPRIPPLSCLMTLSYQFELWLVHHGLSTCWALLVIVALISRRAGLLAAEAGLVCCLMVATRRLVAVEPLEFDGLTMFLLLYLVNILALAIHMRRARDGREFAGSRVRYGAGAVALGAIGLAFLGTYGLWLGAGLLVGGSAYYLASRFLDWFIEERIAEKSWSMARAATNL